MSTQERAEREWTTPDGARIINLYPDVPPDGGPPNTIRKGLQVLLHVARFWESREDGLQAPL